MIVSEVIKSGIVTQLKGAEMKVEIACGDEKCSGCHASRLCQAGSSGTFITATPDDFVSDIRTGDKVIVVGRIKGWITGWLILALLPCMLVIIGLIAGFALHISDISTGFACIMLLVFYYALLWRFRRKLNKQVEWVVVKKEE